MLIRFLERKNLIEEQERVVVSDWFVWLAHYQVMAIQMA
jgi:hypothetical protein